MDKHLKWLIIGSIIVLAIIGFIFISGGGIYTFHKTNEVDSGGCSPSDITNEGINYKFNEPTCTQQLCTQSNGNWVTNGGINTCMCRGTCTWDTIGCDCLVYANG